MFLPISQFAPASSTDNGKPQARHVWMQRVMRGSPLFLLQVSPSSTANNNEQKFDFIGYRSMKIAFYRLIVTAVMGNELNRLKLALMLSHIESIHSVALMLQLLHPVRCQLAVRVCLKSLELIGAFDATMMIMMKMFWANDACELRGDAHGE